MQDLEPANPRSRVGRPLSLTCLLASLVALSSCVEEDAQGIGSIYFPTKSEELQNDDDSSSDDESESDHGLTEDDDAETDSQADGEVARASY